MLSLTSFVYAGLGTVEEVGTVEFVAGRTYKITVLYSNLPSEVDHDDGDEEEDENEKQPSLMMAALRLGGAPRIEEDVAIAEAVQLAQEADAVILVIGTTMVRLSSCTPVTTYQSYGQPSTGSANQPSEKQFLMLGEADKNSRG
jgi:hypothetical protein